MPSRLATSAATELRSEMAVMESETSHNPTTTHKSDHGQPFFSSYVTDRSGDFAAEPNPPVQWPFLYLTLSTVARFSTAV